MIAGSTYYFQNASSSNDHDKIKKIADNCGLKTSDGSIQIYRKKKQKYYSEYIYKIPLGLSFQQFIDHKQTFIDGLNNKNQSAINLENLKSINWKGDVLKQLKDIFNNRIHLDKQLELEYDGMLKFRVYERGLEKLYRYDDDLLEKLNDWQVPIGYTYRDLIKHNFEKMQMLVVAGMTRYGKTVFLKNLITTLIHNKPDDVQFTLIDLKGGLAFNRFANCKQVINVAKDAHETIQSLEEIHTDMLNRQKEFLKRGYEDITEAKHSKRHFIVIDEGAEITGFEDKKQRERCTYLIGEIARIGAGLGYRQVFCTQYATADVFPRTVKANTSAALCFKLKNGTQSAVVLDHGGAEELPAGLYGRAIYQSDKEHIVQTPYIENEYIDNKIKIHIQKKEDSHVGNKRKRDETPRANTIKFEEI